VARSRRKQHEETVAVPVKGKWAQGIQPRNFAWILKDRLAVCERPGGYGANHRRVRRPGGDHLDPRAGVHLRRHADPVAAQPAQLRRARRPVAARALRSPRGADHRAPDRLSGAGRHARRTGGKVLVTRTSCPTGWPG
jgi:hypothetical protein